LARGTVKDDDASLAFRLLSVRKLRTPSV
jgi:hypothetical protein